MFNYGKCVLICAISILVVKIESINVSDNFLLDNNEMHDRLLNASCKYQCAYQQISLNTSCSCDLTEIDFHSLPARNVIVQLLCKETDKIVLQVKNYEGNENMTYFIESMTLGENSWNYFNRFNTNIFIIDNLKEDEKYQFRIWPLSITEGNIFEPFVMAWVKTKSAKEFLAPIAGIELLGYEYNDDDYKAIIRWNASHDKSCHHDFVWFGGDDLSDWNQLEMEIPANYTITIDKLLFNSNYSIAIMTKSTDWAYESEKVWFHFTTPHCLQVLNTLEFCVPQMPSGVNAEEELVVSDENERFYNINITWRLPDSIPEYYVVHLHTFQPDNSDEMNALNISGNAITAFFENAPVSLHYQVTIYAYSNAGRSDPGEFYKQVNPKEVLDTLTAPISKAYLLIIIPLIIMFCIASIILGYKELNKREQAIKRQRYFEELELKSHYLDSQLDDDNISENADEWEIDINCLTLQSVLGRGAFGIVRKGWLQTEDNKVAVAVKMLLDDHRFSDMRDFKHEIEIMKSVGSHPHIVSLIGCCTKGKPDDLRLIVEYCARGDLLTYLRTTWEQISNQCSNIQYANLENQDLSNVDNKLYLLGVNDTWNMQVKDLVSIGLQIAMGMEYLSSLHVLHRDLAARNVLVCEDQTVKVSDFGLSRDVYRDNVYCKTSSGKLPIRWLALESLTHQVYTTQSDVWSYGILLWEIITLGGNPYPGVQTQDLLELLIKGYRMNCPSNCSQELYTIMMSCWNSSPKDRPTFMDIRKMLEAILEFKSKYLNLNLCNSLNDLNEIDDMRKLNMQTKSLSSERYVKAFAQ